MLPLVLIAAVVLPSAAQYTRCITCATPGLRNNWLMTGIEKPPANLAFVDGCAALPDGGNNGFQQSTYTFKCDTGYCLEMAIPTGEENHYEFLRGCYESLIKDGNTVSMEKQTLTGKGVCHKFEFTGTNKINVVHYCKGEVKSTEAEPAACNFRIALTAGNTVLQSIPAEDGYQCVGLNSVNCVTCTRTDGAGSCDSSSKNPQKGPLCVKTRGMVNGREFEERGPSFIPPFAQSSWDKCGIPSTLNSTTYLGPAFGTSGGQSLTRRKRSLKQLFGGTKCYCKGEMCNGSPIMGGLPATLLFVLSAVPFFL